MADASTTNASRTALQKLSRLSRRHFLAGTGATLATLGTELAIGSETAEAATPQLLKFSYPETRKPKPGDDPYLRTPIAATFEQRRKLYLQWAAKKPTPTNGNAVWMELLKLEADTNHTLTANVLDASLNARRDTSDFTIAGLVRLYYLHHADGRLSQQQADAIRDVLLDYKYALDEPGLSEAEIWTENHQIITHGSDYLLGQMFPDAIFKNDGRTGSAHRDKAHGEVLRWLNYRARVGPAEWDSVPYYNMDLAALLNLVDFAGDDDIQSRATMMVDLYLFDMAVNSFYGQMGTSHGRAYAQHIMSAAGDSLVSFQTMIFGCGRFQSVDMACTMLATSRRYTLPPVLEAIGLDQPAEMLNRERHSIPLTTEAAAQYGLKLDDVKDYETWWAMGAFTNPEVINMTYDALDRNHMWNYEMFKPLHTTGRVLRPLGLMPMMTRLLNPDSNGTVMSEVNKVTYRTPDAMLSTAQSYRPGQKGYQHHIWQATLGPYAVVFVTHPGDAKSVGPGFWQSNMSLPRNAQYKNVLVSVYNIQRHGLPTPLQRLLVGFTHAYFPRWAFDEVWEVRAANGGGWNFARLGDGYVGLYSHAPYLWTTDGTQAGQEIVAKGRQNIWLCQVGRKQTDGSFEEFVQKLSQSAIAVDGLQVEYAADGIGKVDFGWTSPLTVDGKNIPLTNYPRWENPYAQIEFGSEQFHIHHNGKELNLDFTRGIRNFS